MYEAGLRDQGLRISNNLQVLKQQVTFRSYKV